MSRRIDAVDVARGVALVAMAAYHFTWDLAYFGVVDRTTPFTPPMRFASHAIGSAFLALAGLSLALAHGRGFRARPFVIRLVKIAVAAALVTAASWFIAPSAVIGFGILHCIGVASLIAVPVLMPGQGASRVSALAALAGGVLLVAAPFVWSSPAFNPPWLVWLGLGTEAPSTLDWRPLMPWGGALWIGLGLGLLNPQLPLGPARAAPMRALAFAGRHSLAFYLIHQLVLMGLLWSVLTLSGASERLAAESYVKTCRPACVEAGGEIAACQRACACVVRDATTAGLASRLSASGIAQSERQRIGAIVDACGADPDR
jgi:uncharacterized membrane protein